MAGFLKCDEAGCDHLEDTPNYGPHLIGKACPKCGANLLTREDFDGYEPLRLMQEALIEAGIAWADPCDVPDGKKVADIGVHFHAGKTTITHGESK